VCQKDEMLDQSKDSVRFAVVGAGSMGANHIRVLSELDGAELVGVVDPSAEKRVQIADQFGIATFDSVDDMLGAIGSKIDAATVATSSITHAAASIPLITAGIATLIEKPLAPTLEECYSIKEAAEKSGAICAVGHIERFNPGIERLRSQLEDLVVGDIFGIASRRVGPAPGTGRSMDYGVLLDLATHDLDVVCSLLDDQPYEIYCASGSAKSGNLEDFAHLLLKFSSGVIASIEVNWLASVKVRDVRVTGAKGELVLDYRTQELLFTNVESISETAPTVTTNTSQVDIQTAEPLARELAHFADMVRSDGVPDVSLDDGIRAVELAVAATESARLGRPIVLRNNK
jgi:UDP-N-acetylglucosamine 3-dehydrogenase